MLDVFIDVHNETGSCNFRLPSRDLRLTTVLKSPVNIHSHLWGAVLFVYLMVTFPSYIRQFPRATWMDVAVACVFLSSAVFCLSASAFYHAASCHSQSVRRRARQARIPQARSRRTYVGCSRSRTAATRLTTPASWY